MRVDLSGTVLGQRYRLLELIGSGGMGRVYAAEHIALRQRVSIKVLHEELSRDPVNVDRFLREARAASGIHHDHVVDIRDFGKSPDGTVFFVMEYLEGEELTDRMRRDGPMAWPAAQQIILQVVRGLKAAHDNGVIHRDVKPANIFLARRPDGCKRVKVLDFGIAKLVRDRRSAAAAEGRVFGTARYMSPEQAAGRDVDERTDVYATAVVLYEMLTGRAPFEGDDFFEVAMQHIEAPIVPPRQVSPAAGIPNVVEDLVMRALAKDPEDRYPNMAEFEAAIESTAFESTVCHLNPLDLEEVDETIVWAERGRQLREATPPPMVMEIGPEDIVEETVVRAHPEPPPMVTPEPACDRSAFTTMPPAPRPVRDADPRTQRTAHPPTYPPTYPPAVGARAPMAPMALYPTSPPELAANPATGKHCVSRDEGAETQEFVLRVPKRERSRNAMVIVASAVAAVCIVGFALAWSAWVTETSPRPEVYPAAVKAQPRSVSMPELTLAAAHVQEPAAAPPAAEEPSRRPAHGADDETTNTQAGPASPRSRERREPRRARQRAPKTAGLASARPAIVACGREHGAIEGTTLRATFDVLGGRASSVRIHKPQGITPLGRCVAAAISAQAEFSEDAPNVSQTVTF